MSGGGARPTFVDLLRKAASLAVLMALVLVTDHLAPGHGQVAPLLALGLFLLAGDLAADLVERIGLPHLTGYILAGMLVGPHVLNAVTEPTVKQLGPVNTLALALIALSAGAELTWPLLTSGARSLLWSVFTQILLVLPASMLALLALKQFIPFLAPLGWGPAIGVAIVWGVISVSRSPSATLGVLSQLHPAGPLTNWTLTVVITFDLVVLVAFSLARASAQVLIEPGSSFSVAALRELAVAMLGSFACGATLGLLVGAYLKLINKQLILFLLVVAYGASELTTYFHFESMLLFLSAGFVVANITSQGEELLDAVAAGGRVIYVLFFALAGAHLDLSLLIEIWPVALALFAVRAATTVVSARWGSRLARDSALIKTYGWMPLISQAGVTIGMAVTIGMEFPTLGPPLASLVIAVVGLNEGLGPVLFKLALDRTGETGKGVHGGHPVPAAAAPSRPEPA